MRLLKIAVCAMVGSILGGCFLSKIEVYDVSAGEVLAIANIDLVCTLADDSGSRGYVAKIVPLGDPKANRYDFASLFRPDGSEQVPAAFTQAVFHRADGEVYVGVDKTRFGGESIMYFRISDESFDIIMPSGDREWLSNLAQRNYVSFDKDDPSARLPAEIGGGTIPVLTGGRDEQKNFIVAVAKARQFKSFISCLRR